jgi:hypothetical protein
LDSIILLTMLSETQTYYDIEITIEDFGISFHFIYLKYWAMQTLLIFCFKPFTSCIVSSRKKTNSDLNTFTVNIYARHIQILCICHQFIFSLLLINYLLKKKYIYIRCNNFIDNVERDTDILWHWDHNWGLWHFISLYIL